MANGNNLKRNFLLNVELLSVKSYLLDSLRKNPNKYNQSEANLIKRPAELF